MYLPYTTDVNNTQQNDYSSDGSAFLCSGEDSDQKSDSNFTDVDEVQPTELSAIMRMLYIVANYNV